jgi:hypothetical protein
MEQARVFCDFNNRLSENTFRLDSVGTRQSLDQLGVELRPGVVLTLFDHDAFADGRAAYIEVDGVVVELPSGELAAAVNPSTFRWTLREQ